MRLLLPINGPRAADEKKQLEALIARSNAKLPARGEGQKASKEKADEQN